MTGSNLIPPTLPLHQHCLLTVYWTPTNSFSLHLYETAQVKKLFLFYLVLCLTYSLPHWLILLCNMDETFRCTVSFSLQEWKVWTICFPKDLFCALEQWIQRVCCWNCYSVELWHWMGCLYFVLRSVPGAKAQVKFLKCLALSTSG